MPNPLRSLPTVNELLAAPQLKLWVERASHTTVVAIARRVLDEVRSQWRSASAEVEFPSPTELIDRIATWVGREERERLIPVINATGLLLSDSLGRAPLAEDALAAAARIGQRYCSLEIDLDSGESMDRQDSVERLLRDLTQAAGARVVNNQSAAMHLAVASLARDGEVLISRGDLYDFGEDYRLATTLQEAGCRLREVGSVNHTSLDDFRLALTPETRLILRVDRGAGPAGGVSMTELVKLGRAHDIPVMASVALASLIEPAVLGIDAKGTLSDWIATGADLILASADKLIGGPSAGLLLGKPTVLEKIARHPLHRAVRVDRLTLASLAATLRLYRDASLAMHRLPLLALLDTPLSNLKLRAEHLASRLRATGVFAEVETSQGQAHLGIWSPDDVAVDSWQVLLKPTQETAAQMRKRLRKSTPVVLSRVVEDRVVLDLRSCAPGEDGAIAELVENWARGSDEEALTPPPVAITSPTLDPVLRRRQEDAADAAPAPPQGNH